MFYITSLDGSNIFCQRTRWLSGWLGVQGWLPQLLPSTSWCTHLLKNYILLLLLTIFCTQFNIFYEWHVFFVSYFTKTHPNSVYLFTNKRQCLMFLAPSEAIYFVNERRRERQGRVGYRGDWIFWEFHPLPSHLRGLEEGFHSSDGKCDTAVWW